MSPHKFKLLAGYCNKQAAIAAALAEAARHLPSGNHATKALVQDAASFYAWSATKTRLEIVSECN